MSSEEQFSSLSSPLGQTGMRPCSSQDILDCDKCRYDRVTIHDWVTQKRLHHCSNLVFRSYPQVRFRMYSTWAQHLKFDTRESILFQAWEGFLYLKWWESWFANMLPLGQEEYDLLLLVPAWVWEVVGTCVVVSRALIVIVKWKVVTHACRDSSQGLSE